MESSIRRPDDKLLMDLHRQYIEDPVIHELTREKVAILSLANKYMVVNSTKTQLLSQFIDERSQKLIDLIDAQIEDRYQMYYSMLNSI